MKRFVVKTVLQSDVTGIMKDQEKLAVAGPKFCVGS